MNTLEFVSLIRRLVMDAAVQDTITVVTHPPGRRPTRELVELSGWYHGLSELEREKVKQLLCLAARNATFGFLAVLDGARVSVNSSSKTEPYFELRYVEGDSEQILSGPRGDVLHELL